MHFKIDGPLDPMVMFGGGAGGKKFGKWVLFPKYQWKATAKTRTVFGFLAQFLFKKKAISIKLNDLTSSSNIELQLKFFYEFIIHLDHKWDYYGESNLSDHNQRGRQQRVEQKDKKGQKRKPIQC